ncbi:leader peptidase (prepilin peptidase) / N-methyltransferase [Selenomonas ruminantium]|uniref:Leader peptidase (Prepilin peptidase) / N-methyltransferase n=1 Tax=Selenomonas ruminantium TaxID=971 RepID=A0A1H0RRE3_SELRU|nr:A24 family peptidase [Selenomonas ruminantium]SDP31546.1 leader peptidase (prepilin peptidase) / N-methyltransferase [Selenomonas ruminantium]
MLLTAKILLAIAAAVAGAIGGSRWIARLYQQSTEILSFPHEVQKQNRQRKRYLPAALGVLFAFYLLSAGTGVLSICLNLFYIFFLVIFTVTDFEQQVIFDKMLLPFALLGVVAAIIGEAGLISHLLAALGGGVLFLLLAILTRGGIGGGDIKLVAALGLWLGVSSLSHVVVVGFIGGGIGALIMMLFCHKKRTDTFAYGPYFTIAALLMLLL